MSGGFSTAISAAATGSISPALDRRSISRRGWKRSQAKPSAPSWRRKGLPASAGKGGATSANSRSPVLRRRRGSTGWRTKRRRRRPAEQSLLRLGREQQRIALGAAGVGGARRLGLGDVPGEDGDDADAAAVGGYHHL